MSDPENDRNHLACPKCKSTELDFQGLHNNIRTAGAQPGTEPGSEVVSGSYKWTCRVCEHEFEVTPIRN